MRIRFVFLTLLFVFIYNALAYSSGLLIRSPYADENLRIFLEINDDQVLKAFQEMIESAAELRKPYPGLAPMYRFELKTSAQNSAVYDFVPYRKGKKIYFWHSDVLKSVSVMHVKKWCQTANISFKKYFEFPADLK
ncbi:MAG: hypothetical protein GY710_16045 [Desulfobacteraceae bacterium]|nr:hypothetical protein [Desulfobacteraceae bacterium]